MRVLGELCLLTSFVGSGFAAFAFLLGSGQRQPWLRRAGSMAAAASLISLTAVMAILAWALYTKDFGYAYVAAYSSKLLPWHYSLSALWVGQAGSLLLWAWFMGVLAAVFGFWPRRQSDVLRAPAFGLLMGYVCFLTVIMVFAADPMEASTGAVQEGAGLSPLLQHPAMLIHPPIVFLGYALWTVPFALGAAALLTGQLDATWIRGARPWALAAWAVLGAGILLGADWAYEELGWGGYWGWDPVENGSLLPWLTGTVLIHGMMAWQYRGILKKTTLAMGFVTFCLCNFATFLTRSGVFSSLHAFSESPIGWLFLGLMLAIAAGGVVLLVRRKPELRPAGPVGSVLSREAGVLVGAMAFLLLAVAVMGGTLSMALSSLITGRTVMVGPSFYNSVLIPTGLVLLLVTAVVPLLRWGKGPTRAQRNGLLISIVAAAGVTVVAGVGGVRHPIMLGVIGLATVAIVALTAALVLDARRRMPGRTVVALWTVLRWQRRQYSGFLIHLGLVCLALGIAGSGLGKREQGFTLTAGQTVDWAGYRIQVVRAIQRDLPDKHVGEVELEVTSAAGRVMRLLPAQHFHKLQEQWTTEVAIHSAWQGDFYAILHSGDLDGNLYLTFIENPLMGWIWAGGGIMLLGSLVRLWPRRRRTVRVVRHVGEKSSEPKRLMAA